MTNPAPISAPLEDLLQRLRVDVETNAIEHRRETAAELEQRLRVEREDRLKRLRDSDIPLEEHMATRIAAGCIGRITDRVVQSDDELARRSLEPTAMLRAARELVHVARHGIVPKPFLTLLGSMGRGKTVAGGYVLAELGGHYVRLERACELRKRERVADGDLWDRMLADRVLVVDEIGLETKRPDGLRALQELIDTRNANGKITVLVSNLSETDLRSDYDPRTIDRLASRWTLHTDGVKSFRHPQLRRDWREVLRLRDVSQVTATTIIDRYVAVRRHRQTAGDPVERFVELSWARDRALDELRATAVLQQLASDE